MTLVSSKTSRVVVALPTSEMLVRDTHRSTSLPPGPPRHRCHGSRMQAKLVYCRILGLFPRIPVGPTMLEGTSDNFLDQLTNLSSGSNFQPFSTVQPKIDLVHQVSYAQPPRIRAF